MVSVPDPALFGIAYAMLGPLVSEGAVVLEGAVQAFAYAMLGSLGFGGGVLLFWKRSCEHRRNVRVCKLVLVLSYELLKALRSPSRHNAFAGESTALFGTDPSATKSHRTSPMQHARVSYHTE